MGIRFNADEVFEMAERIEENGAKFYRKASSLSGLKKGAAFLEKLAEMEEGHQATFAAMRAKLDRRMSEETTFDPYMEAALYLHAAADSHGGEGTPAAADSLTGRETLAEILRIAIGLEEKSILFYLGIRDMVSASLGKDKVEAIIGEEKSHIVTLSQELRKLQKA